MDAIARHELDDKIRQLECELEIAILTRDRAAQQIVGVLYQREQGLVARYLTFGDGTTVGAVKLADDEFMREAKAVAQFLLTDGDLDYADEFLSRLRRSGEPAL